MCDSKYPGSVLAINERATDGDIYIQQTLHCLKIEAARRILHSTVYVASSVLRKGQTIVSGSGRALSSAVLLQCGRATRISAASRFRINGFTAPVFWAQKTPDTFNATIVGRYTMQVHSIPKYSIFRPASLGIVAKTTVDPNLEAYLP